MTIANTIAKYVTIASIVTGLGGAAAVPVHINHQAQRKNLPVVREYNALINKRDFALGVYSEPVELRYVNEPRVQIARCVREYEYVEACKNLDKFFAKHQKEIDAVVTADRICYENIEHGMDVSEAGLVMFLAAGGVYAFTKRKSV